MKTKLSARARDRRIAKKMSRGLCATPHCRNAARKGRSRCNSCRSRAYDDPQKVKFWNLRKSAKRRGIPFSLTFSIFKKIVAAFGYLSSYRDLHVDRKDRDSGYHSDNIQILDASEHGSKTWAERHGWTWQAAKLEEEAA